MQDKLLEQLILATDDLDNGLLLLSHKGSEGQSFSRRKKAENTSPKATIHISQFMMNLRRNPLR
jgi:aminoglycoside/choline kinase family phosphotransferase